METLEIKRCGLKPGFATDQLCDLGQVLFPQFPYLYSMHGKPCLAELLGGFSGWVPGGGDAPRFTPY